MGGLATNSTTLGTDSLSQAYDRLVNGSGLSAWQLVTNDVPYWTQVPTTNEPGLANGGPLAISLDTFENERLAIATANPDLMPTISQILIHGSQATNDICDFSDVDVLVIIDDSRMFSSEEHTCSLKELRRLLASIYAYDSLMHHGLMFLPASALRQYDETFLPIETLKTAKSFHGSKQLRIHLSVPNCERVAGRIRIAITSLRGQMHGGLDLRGDYHLKNFISGVLLLPALLLARHGIFVYKRESFELARPYFSPAAWDFIAGAEEVRRKWIRPSDTWLKRVVGAMGHPATTTLISRILPSKVNLTNRAINSSLRVLERRADTFFGELQETIC